MQKKERLTCASVLLGILAIFVVLGLLLRYGRAEWLYRGLLATHRGWEKPLAFGGFHLIWLLFCVVFAVLLAILGARRGRTICDRLTFGFGISFLWLELYKQLYSFLVLWDGHYDFGILPFQFCSLPLYLCPIAALLPAGRIKESLYRFLALFGTMGGCLVMVYPRFWAEMALCFHTMLWHTLMICLGVFLLYARGYGKSWRREVLPATVVFLLALGLATALNLVLAPLSQASPNPLNLFYMSPYQSTYFLVVKDVWAAWGWGAAMLAYILLFIFVGATLVFLVAFLSRRLGALLARREKKKEKN